MIILHAFGNMFPGGVGETKDLWVQWGLEEMGLAYETRAWDYNGGETQTPAFRAISPFGQLPLLEDDGLVLAETPAILMHLAETYDRLTPPDAAGRAEVRQWCVAAVATVMPALSMLGFSEGGMLGEAAQAVGSQARELFAGISTRWLEGLERRLGGEGTPRPWLMGPDFTIADVMMAGALREIRHSDRLDGYPLLKAYHARALARPAWRRTVAAYAKRMGVETSAVD